MADYFISLELINLSRRIFCSFIDARTSSKDCVGNIGRSFSNKEMPEERVLLSTCLRFEIYKFDGPRVPVQPLFYTEGVTCIRRLLSIMTGLQSEIIGEKEVLMQVTKSINDAFEVKKIDEETYSGLQHLLRISQQIRTSCLIETDENYSTIGATLLHKYIQKDPNAVVMVIGGGYMSEAFLKAIDMPLVKLIWANRSVSKLKKRIGKMNSLCATETIFCNLDEARQYLSTTDIIFSAISNSPNYFKNEKLGKGSIIIDVSYPQVFEEHQDLKIINISNTYFDKLTNNPISKKSITLANREIDNVCHKLS